MSVPVTVNEAKVGLALVLKSCATDSVNLFEDLLIVTPVPATSVTS